MDCSSRTSTTSEGCEGPKTSAEKLTGWTEFPAAASAMCVLMLDPATAELVGATLETRTECCLSPFVDFFISLVATAGTGLSEALSATSVETTIGLERKQPSCH